MAEENTPAPTLTPKKIYLKDASFESPGSPNVFLQAQMKPDIDLNLNVDFASVEGADQFYDVVLQVTCTAAQDEQTMFIAEIKQAGVFEIHAQDQSHIDLILNVACPNMLLPFAREELASLVSKGGFPQLLMQPINFETMYRQRLAEESTGEPEPAPISH